MIYRGRVTSGVVVLEGGVQLPEGTAVTVEPIEITVSDPSEDPLYHLTELATHTGISDLALNVDHYLYGHPKATDADQ